MFLAGALGVGGAERQMVVLARQLARRGHDVSVVLFYRRTDLLDTGEAAGIPLHFLDKRGKLGWPAAWMRLKRLLAAERPDILHSYLTTPNIMAALAKPWAKEACIVWGVRASDMRMANYGWPSVAADWLEARLSRFADRAIANSVAGRDRAVTRGFPRGRIEVIANGVDTDVFKPEPDAGAAVRREWDVPDGAKLVGIVGRLDPMKGHDCFLRAASALASERTDVFFAVVGEGLDARSRGGLQSRAAELGLAERVVWSDFRRDLPAVYSAFDLLVSASIYGEGFSNVLAEGMACGTPVAATNVGDAALVVGDERRVTKPGDPVAMAALWRRLLNEGRGDGPALRQRIVSLYSLDVLAEKSERALSELVAYMRRRKRC